MEGQAATRRINTIAGHFSPAEDLSASHVLPMNCSSTLNSAIQRRDSRLYFSRQGATFRPCFMKPGSPEDVLIENESQCNGVNLPAATARILDNKLLFARQGSAYQGGFMRQGCNEEVLPVESDAPEKGSGAVNEPSYYVSGERPSFSRPINGATFSTAGRIEPFFEGYGTSAIDRPKFSVASRIKSQRTDMYSKRETYSSPSIVEWSPRMDVAESGRGYVITVEIPGVNIKDIRVEVDEKKLTVTGKRSGQYMKVAGFSNDSVSAYLRREIVQGPCEVVWPLPTNVNKDRVSAEFMDGFLRVVIPKL